MYLRALIIYGPLAAIWNVYICFQQEAKSNFGMLSTLINFSCLNGMYNFIQKFHYKGKQYSWLWISFTLNDQILYEK
jgi:hypothetical protein